MTEVRMTRLFKQLTALLLCLCLLLPTLACAEGAHALRFTLEGELNPEAYPEAERPLMASLAELMDMMTLEGTFEFNDACIDLNMNLLLDQAEETRTSFRLYGCEDTWALQSSLLGGQQLYFPLTSLLEFCMKAYFHLNIPLQRVGLLLTPYVHKDAFATFASLWEAVMNTTDGTRTIARKDVLELAEQIADASWTDRAFTYWVMALALESGYDTAIMDAVAGLYDWVDSFLAEDGLTITVDGENQHWATGSTMLFSRTVRENRTTMALSLPESPDGYVVSGFLTAHRDTALSLNARLTVTQEESSILDMRLSVDDLPLTLADQGIYSLNYDVTGAAMPDGFHIGLEGTFTDGLFTIRQLNTQTGEIMLTLHGTVAAGQTVSPLNWTARSISGVAFFSVSDTTLSKFAADVLPSFARGMLPLLAHMPINACQQLMNLVTDTGILDLMTASSTRLDGESTWDSEDWPDEEDWFDEDFDDLAWDDGSAIE
ncbi:MAG: hypothetical protein ACI4MJ_10490 [Aristaeellaceae bacterium]